MATITKQDLVMSMTENEKLFVQHTLASNRYHLLETVATGTASRGSLKGEMVEELIDEDLLVISEDGDTKEKYVLIGNPAAAPEPEMITHGSYEDTLTQEPETTVTESVLETTTQEPESVLETTTQEPETVVEDAPAQEPQRRKGVTLEVIEAVVAGMTETTPWGVVFRKNGALSKATFKNRSFPSYDATIEYFDGWGAKYTKKDWVICHAPEGTVFAPKKERKERGGSAKKEKGGGDKPRLSCRAVNGGAS